ncbi:Rha family transcriptional regulator [Azospirillum agricola]|uniref:hypothetical protein n=1 Tax=Azospirillum agricola TaxID=1720247 RepID=UPI000A0EFA68|nr:hypothetical protein [Azospirillum agricola]SMH60464.1 hypothetical protein SAMN02982994_5507 [Azospirillum lipoferum]
MITTSSEITPASSSNATLTVASVEGEARILDTDLASRLGFAEPRMIRNLIKRHLSSLDALGVRSTVKLTPENNGLGGASATAFMLNRKQAIFITAKSETVNATDITIEIIERFDAYEKGLLSADADELARRTDGIARMLARKVTGLERTVAELANTLQALASGVTNLALAADGRVAGLALISVRQLMDQAGALSKGRNSLNRRVRNALMKLAATTGVKGVTDCPHTGVTLFPIDFAREFMTTTGNAWVAAHNASLAPQGDLFAGQPAKKRKTKAPRPANDAHPRAANSNSRKKRGAA